MEVALGIKDKHDIVGSHAFTQLGNDLKDAVGLAHADAAQEKHVFAEQVITEGHLLGSTLAILAVQKAAGLGTVQVWHGGF